MKYRSDIDGLRGLAVLSVIFYHLKIPCFSGGFIGVDVFFVLSGYLITSIILGELQSGTFSIGGFYERRIKRIFPALFAVVFASLTVGYFVDFPNSYITLVQSAAAAALFSSNMYFWHRSDYFNSDLESMPLIHTWSLGIEEQFYLLFPVILIFIFRAKRSWLPYLLFVLLLVSFSSSVLVTASRPVTAFYLLPTRCWELLAGSIISPRILAVRGSRLVRNVYGLIGLLLFLYAILTLTSASVFPGVNALLPVASAVLLILAGPDSLAGRILSTRLIVFTGLISYSLYLWHWPIVSFYETLAAGTASAAQTASLIVCIVLVSVASFYLIERPFRRVRVQRGWLFSGALAAIAATVFVSVNISRAGGIVRDYPPDIMRIVSYDAYASSADEAKQFDEGTCFDAPKPQYPLGFIPAVCLTIDQHRPNVLLMGDSHAAQLSLALRVAYPEVHWLQATEPWCKPVFMPEDSAFSKHCPHFLNYVLNQSLNGHHLDTIIIAARWLPDDVGRIRPAVQFLRRYASRVVVLGPIEEYSQPLPILLGTQLMLGHSSSVITALRDQPWQIDAQLPSRVASSGGTYVSLLQVMCPAHKCVQLTDGRPVQFDYGHLTNVGAMLLIERLQLGITSPAALCRDRQAPHKKPESFPAVVFHPRCPDLSRGPQRHHAGSDRYLGLQQPVGL